MNDTATAAPGAELAATAAPDTSVSAAGEQQSAETAQAPSESSDYADALAMLERLERGEEPQTIEAAPAGETITETTAEEAAAAEAATTAAGEGKKKQRISVRGINESAQHEFAAAADLVRSGKAANLAEAVAQLSATQQATASADAPATQAQAVPEAVATITTQIAELRAQRKQANADFDGDKADELTVQIEDLQIERLRAEQSATVRTAQVQSYQQEYDKAVDELEAAHPEATDETTPFYQVLSDRLEAAKARKDPALADPRFILKMAGDVAKMLGTATKPAAQAQPASKPAAAAARAPQTTLQPPPARASRPVGSALAGGQVAASPLTPEQVTALIEAMPYEEKMALLKEL